MPPVTGTVSSPHSRAIAVDQRAGRGEQVRAVVEPVVAARVRAHAPAEPIARLQQQHVAMAQPPRGRQAGDPAADDHHIARHGDHDQPAAASCKVGLTPWRNPKLSFCLCSRSAASARRSSSARSPPPPTSLRVSQPAVAEQIRKLEQALGADLFVRARPRRRAPPRPAARSPSTPTRSLRAVEDAADSVGELNALRTRHGRARRLRRPSAWRLDELVIAFLRRHPGRLGAARRPQLVGRSPSASGAASSRPASSLLADRRRQARRPADRARRGRSTSAPTPSARASRRRSSAWRQTPLVFYDAESADDDPIRRQLAERAQAPRRAPAAQGRGRAQGHRAAAGRRRASATPTSPAPSRARPTTPPA